MNMKTISPHLHCLTRRQLFARAIHVEDHPERKNLVTQLDFGQAKFMVIPHPAIPGFNDVDIVDKDGNTLRISVGRESFTRGVWNISD